MKILGIDSSGLVASVAVIEDDDLKGEYTIHYKKTHSQTLLPMLDEVVKMIELNLNTIDAIAVSAGPGSFTGLRIGSATAKGLGLALEKPLISVPTVDALAYNLVGEQDIICPIMDARREQVYTGLYRFQRTINCEKESVQEETEESKCLYCKNEMQTVKAQCAVGIMEIIEEINQLGQPVVFLGDGVCVYKDVICANCRVPFSFAPAHLNKQRAGAVAALGMIYYQKGQTEKAAEHKPNYLRLSQAERERLERGQKND